jgi:hypothetical protein
MSHDGATPQAAGPRDLLADRRVLVDSVAPPLLFVGLQSLAGLRWAAVVSLVLAALLVVFRRLRGERLLYAVTGLTGAVGGVALALWTGTASAYFVPGIIGNVAATLACAGSVVVRRPLVAVTSQLIYGWPWSWYRHPRVRPAYSEITWAWALLYLGKALLQGWLVQQDAIGALAVVRVLSGYPALAGMLVVTYVYVDRRLRSLGAPDVEEHRQVTSGAPVEP